VFTHPTSVHTVLASYIKDVNKWKYALGSDLYSVCKSDGGPLNPPRFFSFSLIIVFAQ